MSGKFKGIEILSHDKDTFLVQSRTEREEYYLVDLSEMPYSCTCSGYHFRKECFHIRYICKLLGIPMPQANNNNQLKKAA